MYAALCSLSLSLVMQNFELLMTFYTPDVYNGPGDPGSCHQIAVVSGDESSSKHVYQLYCHVHV